VNQSTAHPRRNEHALGARLRARRLELGLTLKEVGDHAGLSVGFISQIERGITTPSLSSLVGVSRVLKMHVSDFLAQPWDRPPDSADRASTLRDRRQLPDL
jgi:transcriptional regulator with XRE-family HTH domain